jgi:hypothetical protein
VDILVVLLFKEINVRVAYVFCAHWSRHNGRNLLFKSFIVNIKHMEVFLLTGWTLEFTGFDTELCTKLSL